MILINSGAYVIPEFEAELGRIPPCMLPIGNKKLIENQVSAFRSKGYTEQIYVTLPESYKLTLNEASLLEKLDVQVVQTNDAFSLAESVLFALNVIDYDEAKSVHLLHGDTFITDIPEANTSDILAIGIAENDYNWKVEYQQKELSYVWCGYFSFSSRLALVKALAHARGDFIQAVNAYRTVCAVSLYLVKDWHDLGHVNTFFQSRASITTQRAFNTLQVNDGVVYKTGEPTVKIQAEANWFSNIPTELKRFIPQLIDHGVSKSAGYFYQLEYLPIIPFNELFVHGRNSPIEWNKLFKLLDEYLKLSRSFQVDAALHEKIEQDYVQLIREKSLDRLERFSKNNNFDLDRPIQYGQTTLPSVRNIAQICIEKSLALPVLASVMHGDLCFSNILFDSRADRVKVIDPRGLTATGELSIYGDQKYDFAKLTHSVIGLYDFIIAGRYELVVSNSHSFELDFQLDDRVKEIQQIFVNRYATGSLTLVKILPIVILLFLSMLPLHEDRLDRQRAMLANAMRLYLMLEMQ